MRKTEIKKIGKKRDLLTPITPFRLSDAARAELERVKAADGVSMTQAVEDRILGKDRFNPEIEALIADYQTQRTCGRNRAIEALIIEVLRYRAGEKSLSSAGKGAAHSGNTDILTKEALGLAEPPPPSAKQKR